jgi:hypothetical protein
VLRVLDGLMRPSMLGGLIRPGVVFSPISLDILPTGKVGTRSGEEDAVDTSFWFVAVFPVVAVPTKESADATLTLSWYMNDPCLRLRRMQRKARRDISRMATTPNMTPRIIASVSVRFS